MPLPPRGWGPCAVDLSSLSNLAMSFNHLDDAEFSPIHWTPEEWDFNKGQIEGRISHDIAPNPSKHYLKGYLAGQLTAIQYSLIVQTVVTEQEEQMLLAAAQNLRQLTLQIRALQAEVEAL